MAARLYRFKSCHPHQKKAHICLPRQCVLFSTKFAFGEWNMASPCEIAPLWNICFANVRGRISFHIATKEQYFTISARKLFHIRRKPNISLKIRNKLRLIYCVSQERYLRKGVRYFKRENYDEVIYLMPTLDGWYKSIYFRNCAMLGKSE